jgi:copper chaperone CopZ
MFFDKYLNHAGCGRRERAMTLRDETIFLVEGMSCDKCAARVIKAIQALAPGAQVRVDLEGRRVIVSPRAADPRAMARAITEAGYPAEHVISASD